MNFSILALNFFILLDDRGDDASDFGSDILVDAGYTSATYT